MTAKLMDRRREKNLLKKLVRPKPVIMPFSAHAFETFESGR